MKKDEITAFAKKHGYEGAVYLCEWNGFSCYEPCLSKEKAAFTGLPLLILAQGDKIRMSTPDEAMKQLEETGF